MPAERIERGAFVSPSLGVSWANRQCLVVTADRVLVPAHMGKRGTLVVPSHREARINCQRFIMAAERLFVSAKSIEFGALVGPKSFILLFQFWSVELSARPLLPNRLQGPTQLRKAGVPF